MQINLPLMPNRQQILTAVCFFFILEPLETKRRKYQKEPERGTSDGTDDRADGRTDERTDDRADGKTDYGTETAENTAGGGEKSFYIGQGTRAS